MFGIKEALKRIYSGEDALMKHLILFALTGIPAMLASPLNQISHGAALTSSVRGSSLFALLLVAVVSVYMVGYMYGVINKSFDDNNVSILPKFDKCWFKAFLKGFPVQLVWGIYFLLFIVIASVSFILIFYIAHVPFTVGRVFSSVSLLNLIFFVAMPFVYVRFAENYERNGLYNILLPFKDLIHSIKDVFILALKLLPILLLIGILGVFGMGNTVDAYIITAIVAYLTAIFQYCALFCYVQIYKSK